MMSGLRHRLERQLNQSIRSNLLCNGRGSGSDRNGKGTHEAREEFEGGCHRGEFDHLLIVVELLRGTEGRIIHIVSGSVQLVGVTKASLFPVR